MSEKIPGMGGLLSPEQAKERKRQAERERLRQAEPVSLAAVCDRLDKTRDEILDLVERGQLKGATRNDEGELFVARGAIETHEKIQSMRAWLSIP